MALEVTIRSSGHRTQAIAWGIVILIVLRVVVGGLSPLSYDETYYWLWSKHLAAGYYDHPPSIAYAIRAGTLLFGDKSMGVRFVPWLLSVAASWAVWRTGKLLLKSEYGAALATLFFNLMPMIGVEALVATPDAPEIAAAAFVLLALAEISQTGRGDWWIAVGIAAGFALLSKYTAFFLGAGILVWLAAVPKERHWFFSIWPYLGATIALLMFAPVVLWNAQHDWISFAKQFGRVGEGGFTLRFLGEFLLAQLTLATPFIAVLGTAGIVTPLRRHEDMRSELSLPLCMIAPAALYFVWHSLHERVQGNWPSFLYPAFAVAAAAAYMRVEAGGWSFPLRVSRLLAVPLAVAMIIILYAQALWDVIPGVRDPISRLLGFGMDRVAGDIEALRTQNQAGAVLTTGYALTGWLTFYMQSHPPVIQMNERVRYLDQPAPPRSLFQGSLLYVTETRNDQSSFLAMRFAHVTPLAHLTRVRGSAKIDEYAVYSVSGLRNDPFDQGK